MEEQFKTLIVLSHYLETARFRQFWDEAAKSTHNRQTGKMEMSGIMFHYCECYKSRHILEVVPGFEQAIQASVLAEVINIEGLVLDKFIENHIINSGWAIEKNQTEGQLIILPHNEFNDSELKKSAADGIPLE
ncbi:eukaryotic translation initiation factor 3 subunit K-like [Salvia divinorum]|uniref:Eukaryotic translation initiation factor 3 subunit K-like n=1 Tax=Salvia divinorum TaxID=28513 RepID=A0ABD1FHH1_SALDI